MGHDEGESQGEAVAAEGAQGDADAGDRAW